MAMLDPDAADYADEEWADEVDELAVDAWALLVDMWKKAPDHMRREDLAYVISEAVYHAVHTKGKET